MKNFGEETEDFHFCFRSREGYLVQNMTTRYATLILILTKYVSKNRELVVN